MSDLEASDAIELNAVYYGQEFARLWERDFGTRPDTAIAVDCLDKFADGRPVLEFGIGTGRLALPLYRKGIDISGIEYSPWMVDELRTKPNGEHIPVYVGDFTKITVPGSFGLVLLASYTLFGLATQDDQVKCFENAAAHLQAGGIFVLELCPTHGNIYENGRAPMSLGAGWFEPERVAQNVWILLKQVDRETQLVRSCRISMEHEKVPRVRPFAGRFACPGEVDLMARIAGMRLCGRWSDWNLRPYSVDSLSYIVMYEKT